ncbi:MAG TPA: Holliday junction resolvase RuvX [Patescibacteria group bacterium]|nr:Holliday junction resolvase RuvX [Patescibacteria group bacterium]
MNILCFDYGQAKIGVALATTPLAEPYLIIRNEEKVYSEISKIISKFHPERILVGVSNGNQEESQRAFASKLRELYGVEVEEVDETLSTHRANEYLANKKGQKKRVEDDAIAAAIILQDYLDLHS